MNLSFVWVNINNVSDEALRTFNSGNKEFDEKLVDKAREWQSIGEMCTYVAIREDEIEKPTKIYAYASITATGLLANSDDEVKYLSCCEIRLFAIHRGLRSVLDENFVLYSVSLFKSFLQDLYQMSTSVIGFKAIFLMSNDQGYHLYTDEAIGFMSPNGYIPPTDEKKLSVDGCTPLLFFFDDDSVYKIFE